MKTGIVAALGVVLLMAVSQSRGSPQRRFENTRSSFDRNSIGSAASRGRNTSPVNRGAARASPGRGTYSNQDENPQSALASSSFNSPSSPGSQIGSCADGDGFARGESCASYYRCRNGTQTEEQCPDGLVFAKNRSYPCVYPQEGTCFERNNEVDFSAPGVPGQCSRAYQLFRSPSSENDCATYTSCVEGKAFVLSCLPGQAYDPISLICDYADKVPTCNVEEYIGLSCEQKEFGEYEVGVYSKHQIAGECRKFYICLNRADGRIVPRVQSCPDYTAFDPETTLCSETPDQVSGCENLYPRELLQAIQQNKQQQQQRREQRLLEITEKLNG